ncbi:NTP transferase domain-containing protein [Arthrobacter sulfonylureivorans]|uniref:NTP transferase domain-containing protein n=1 Tax=Arthrobacter sulfonylureivorans TaxID=2486855 RepID=UPI0039E4C0D3
MTAADFDAVVLAGGRSSRLGGSPKALLQLKGATLLRHTLEAVRGARRIAVVGPDDLVEEMDAFRRSVAPGPPRLLLTREDPPFSGPAAGIAAGMNALAADDDGGAPDPAPLTLLFACDMPLLAGLPELLLEGAARAPEAQLWIPVDADGRRQQLACCAGRAALAAAVQQSGGAAGLAGQPVRKLLAGLSTVELRLERAGSHTSDVDTWQDAGRFGIARPAP